MGFRPLARAVNEPGNFHAILTAMPPADLVRNLGSIKKGRALEHPAHYDGTGNRLRIRAARPFTYTIDGDLYQSDGQLEMKTGPEVRLIEI